jgi:hypothetical protein
MKLKEVSLWWKAFAQPGVGVGDDVAYFSRSTYRFGVTLLSALWSKPILQLTFV